MYPAMVAELQSNYTLVFSEEDVEKMVTLAEKVRFRSNAAEVEVHNLEGRIKALEAMKKDKTPRQQAAIDKKNAKVLHAWERYQKAEKEPTTKLHAAQVECGIAITMLCTRRHEYVATKKAEEKTEKMLKKTESKKNKEEAKVKLLAEKQKEKDMEQALKEQEKSLKAQSTKMNDKVAESKRKRNEEELKRQRKTEQVQDLLIDFISAKMGKRKREEIEEEEEEEKENQDPNQ